MQTLYDDNFLKELNESQNRETYVQIVALTNDEAPRETLEGRATGGSINVDGKSAIRRSCSLSLVLSKEDNIITDKYWCYNNKFKLRIGLKNTINENYPDIIWFDMGIYIITSFSMSESTTAFTVSLSGKDKMCRLNGEVSGNIAMSTDFGTIEDLNRIEKEDGTTELQTTITKLPIYTIIQNAIKEYGQERPENIIINDLNQYGYELWEYRGEQPMYLFILTESNNLNATIINMTFNGDTRVEIVKDDGSIQTAFLKNLDSEGTPFKFYSMNTLDAAYNDSKSLGKIKWDDENTCYVAKIDYGDTAGYHRIQLVYNNDLILKPGETVTSLLDKLKNMLGNFEYFYDLQGRFVFQKKNNYIQELFSPLNGELMEPTMHISSYAYRFDNSKFFTSIGDSPNINNLKNDFAIWGTRKSATGDDISIHARYALDKKPTYYRAYDGTRYRTKAGNTITPGQEYYDWRELIYQMALDFYKHNQDDDFLYIIEQNNPQFIGGKTGYEQYYSDIQGFWRQLYNPQKTDNDQDIAAALGIEYYGNTGTKPYWNKQIHLDPNTLNFWFDFLDTTGELGNFSVHKIGPRSKVVNENSVKSIYFKETPEVLFIVAPQEQLEENQTSYMPIWIQDSMSGLFYRSTQGLSAVQRANELIFQHTATADTISLTSVPIYHLQPNTKIFVEGHGDYNVDKLTYNLSYNGTMNISGNKIIKQFY